MQPSEDLLGPHAVVMRYFVAVWSRRRNRCEWRWDSRPETFVWMAVIVVRNPLPKNGPLRGAELVARAFEV